MFKHITSEPAICILTFGSIIANTLFSPAFVDKICYQVGQKRYPGEQIDCSKLHSYPSDFYEEIERVSADLNAWGTAAIIISACSIFLLSAWGDRVGRKTIMLISISGELIKSSVNIILIAVPSSPLWLVPFVQVVVMLTGGTGMTKISCCQYIADKVKDKGTLTMRLAFLTSMNSLSFTVGAFISGQLTRVLSVPMTMAVGALIAFTSMAYVLFFIEQKPPESSPEFSRIPSVNSYGSLSKITDEEQELTTEGQLPVIKQEPERQNLFRFLWSLILDIWQTYRKERPGYRRILMWLSVFAFSSASFSTNGCIGLNATYFKTPPLSFTTRSYSYYVVTLSLVVAAGSLGGGFLSRKLNIPNTLVVVISMISEALRPLVYALATENWMIYLGTCLGCLGTLLVCSYQSFLVQLVEKDEVGKIIAGQNFASSIARMISGVMMSEIYKSTVHTCRGAVYFASFALCVLSAIVLFAFHIASRLLTSFIPISSEEEA